MSLQVLEQGTAVVDPKAVAFDVDGVLADTMGLFLRIASEEYRIDRVSYEDITCYELRECLPIDPKIIDAIIGRLLDGTYAHPLQPIPGAARVIGRLAETTGQVVFVTARPYPGPIEDWIQNHLGLLRDRFELVTTGAFEAKAQALLEKGIRHFVDDRLETCFHLQECGIDPIVFRQPWNRKPHPFREVASWEEIQSLIAWPTSGGNGE